MTTKTPAIALCLLIITPAISVACASPPALITMPVKTAAAPYLEKATGTTRFVTLGDEGLKPVLLPFQRQGTLAQSGDGTLGDRVFRENENSMVEGCRWVDKGRVCELVVLPDGEYLGGGVSWIIPVGASATPRAGGWLARGIVHTANRTLLDANAASALSDVFDGRLYHCRFADAGPTCLPVIVAKDVSTVVFLGVHSLRDGATRREVLWVASFGELPGVAELGVKDVYRCETTEETTEVHCQIATTR